MSYGAWRTEYALGDALASGVSLLPFNWAKWLSVALDLSEIGVFQVRIVHEGQVMVVQEYTQTILYDASDPDNWKPTSFRLNDRRPIGRPEEYWIYLFQRTEFRVCITGESGCSR